MYHPNLAGRTKKAKRFSGDEKSGRYIGLDVTGKLAGVRLFLADREIWAKQTFLKASSRGQMQLEFAFFSRAHGYGRNTKI